MKGVIEKCKIKEREKMKKNTRVDKNKNKLIRLG